MFPASARKAVRLAAARCGRTRRVRRWRPIATGIRRSAMSAPTPGWARRRRSPTGRNCPGRQPDRARLSGDRAHDAEEWDRGRLRAPRRGAEDRKSVVEGKSVSVRVALGGRRLLKKQKKISYT